MEVAVIRKQLILNKNSIVESLSKDRFSHFRDYFLIREKYLSNQQDEDFRKVFCRYYIMNGARGLNQQQKVEFFRLLGSREKDLRKILMTLHSIQGYGGIHRLFLSFGSKLLHTIDEKLPIYDRNISMVLVLPKQNYTFSFENRLDNRIDIYKELRKCFVALLSDTRIIAFLYEVRKDFRDKAGTIWKDQYLSDTKLLDSLLWSLYSIQT